MSLHSLDEEIERLHRYISLSWPLYLDMGEKQDRSARQFRAYWQTKKKRLDRLRKLRRTRAENITRADTERALRKADWEARQRVRDRAALELAEFKRYIRDISAPPETREAIDIQDADRYRTTIEWSPLHGDGTLRGVPKGDTSNASHYPS